MENLRAKYEQIVLKEKKLIEQINALADDEKVKKYFELSNQNNELENLQKKLYKQMKIEEYSSCNHIWITAVQDYDSFEGHKHDYCGCIKCGLDKSIFLRKRYTKIYNKKLDSFTLDQRIMYDFIVSDNTSSKGINTNILCNLDLAKAIYSKIKEVHPDIDDETAIKYFKVALYNIRNNKGSDERKESRTKRLSLSPKFNKWTAFDARRYI